MKVLLGNPLLPLLVWSGAFLWIWALRRNAAVVLASSLILFLILFLLGGQSVAGATRDLPGPTERARCVGDAIRAGAWWGEPLPPSCVYRGRPLLS